MRILVLAAIALSLAACGPRREKADLILTGGRVYTLSWPDPTVEGAPSNAAPHDANGWRPDAEAISIASGRILSVGTTADELLRRAEQTRVIDLKGATVVPGLIDSHVHLANLGAKLDRVDLVGVATEAEAVARVVARAATVPKGEWIVGWGWDEGAWTSHLPTMRLLSQRVPDHPVVLHGLHTFASWGNRLAFERAGITRATVSPAGGEIRKDAAGNPTGVLLNNAQSLLTNAMPAPAPAELAGRVVAALQAMAEAGYTAVDEAGTDDALLVAFEDLDRRAELIMPVNIMLAARDPGLVDAWRPRGPRHGSGRLTVRSVKAFYDGAMGSRGAWFLQPYSDRRNSSGVGGAKYGFDRDRVAAMMAAGFQPVIHAIGDRSNREALDLYESVMRASPRAQDTRPRIEHAQVLAAADIPRFQALGVIASMQPSHAVEDMAWAETRIGPERIKGAYAWRSLRRAGARMAFNSDLPATDYNIFYGLHSAVTRTDRQGLPAGGWHPEQRLTIEEALRGWTTWAAYASFREQEAGMITRGFAANLTVMDIDPFRTGESDPARLLDGRIVMTIIGGRIVTKPSDIR
ncbi:MAG TPA: amidohydrolase [Vicinamibacterales bacterium]|nr:amidohydrolase [Vicinamibacterales bacterium]